MIDIAREDAATVLPWIESQLEALRGKTILLTGCTGFVGKGLLQSLIHVITVTGLDTCLLLPIRGGRERLESAEMNAISDQIHVVDWGMGRLQDLLPHKCEYIIHAAGPVDVGYYQQGPANLMREMVALTEDVLEYAAAIEPKKLLYVSSGAVYGDFFDVTNGPVSESCTTAPVLNDWRSCYGEAKRYCELLIGTQGYPSVSARVFSLMGPHLSLDAPFALASFLKQAHQGLNIELHSNGTALRSFLYQSDLTEVLWRLLLDSEATEAYNVGAREPVSIARLAGAVASHFPGTQVKLGKDLNGQRDFYLPNIDKLNEIFHPQLTFEQGLARTISALRQRGVLRS